ncbi:MAG TPA: carbamate kinase [Gaiellales bacterium]|jgi:carbamate kinase|nr:carbamate kinase [Gaiellales bacterium]
MKPLAVVALGGNALLRRGEPAEASHQQANVRTAAASLAVLGETHRLVVTHGNGPQVGLLALQAEAYDDVRPYPLDVLGAETEGMIGYLLDQALLNVLPEGSRVATLLTQTVVDPADPAFAVPSKPIGPVYEPAEGERLARERGWTVRPDGPYVRRVVASPQPADIVEIETIRLLLDAGVLVVCAGGGGIPVTSSGAGLAGVEAVVDKDLSAALLAEKIGADFLLMLTDVPEVQAGWGTPEARSIRLASPQELRGMDFAAGSMGPKVEAACRFAERTGGRAGIGRLDQAAAILRGEAGTIVAGAGYEGTRKPASPTSIRTAAASTAHQP